MVETAQDQRLEPSPPWDLGLLTRTIGAAGGLVYSWCLRTGRLDWAGEAPAALGLAADDLPRHADDFQKRIAPDDLPARAIALSRLHDGGTSHACEFKFRRSDGGYEWLEENGSVDLDEHGEPIRFLGLLRVITSRKNRESGLERLAFFDELTGHLNRARLEEALDEILTNGDQIGAHAAFLLVNIDRLGMLNSAYGFDIADAVIVEIAKRVENCTRVGDIIGRAGGNQFGLVLSGEDSRNLQRVADQILVSVRDREVNTGAGPLAVSLSLGGLQLSDDLPNSREVMGRAEEALSNAKSQGRDRFALYRSSANRRAARRKSLATGDAVLRALKDDRIKLAVQPIIDAESGETRLYECLMRMLDEDGTVVPAGIFIPVVEQLGLIRRLDVHTLELALCELAEVPDVNLAVNVSGMTATDPSTLDHLLSLVHVHAGVADRLIIEITETVAMMDYEEVARFSAKLRDLGCRIALDDFGAGYTSFRHLKSLDVDLVKIDGQFVKDLPVNSENQLFVQTLLDLANGFGAEVVGECVENEGEAEALRQRGVQFLQGYHFGAPTLERPWEQSSLHVI
ncbi:MAG: EAL domain-containing protein [Alphaproteobacteria bacterium]|nr:EAL domain-containing protein [Alphaproteobacteria bacterium]MDP6815608.1 EAL domain-containing protein [Alphaproteobacteria bacterium]